MIDADARNEKVIWPFLIGRDLVTGDGTPTRFVIDFQGRDLVAAQTFKKPYTRIEHEVLPEREEKARQGMTADGRPRPHHAQFLRSWWLHSFERPELISLIATLSRYIVCSDTTKRPIFEFVSPRIRPDHKLRVFTFSDEYSFGIMQSSAHWIWFITKCSKLNERFNYTSSSVYDTFPWPQSPTCKQIESVASAAVAVRRVRTEALAVTTGGLRAVYRTMELPGKHPLKDAHAALDAAVLAAYGFEAKKDLLAQLLELNLSVSAREKQGLPVTAPGVPPTYGDASKLITEDCIKP